MIQNPTNTKAFMKILRALLIWLFLLPKGWAAQLSPLAKAPDWAELEQFQESITRERFLDLLNRVYAPNDAAAAFIQVDKDAALIRKRSDSPELFVLRFAQPGQEKRPPRFWKRITELGEAPKARPLSGYTIALDPGHLGGPWAKVEERWFQIGAGKPVAEGDLTLRVARILAGKLRDLGASVLLVRNSAVPTTRLRPENLRKTAANSLRSDSIPFTPQNLRRESERLFYRVAEIRGRAAFLNTTLKPDLTLCLHFNAEGWGNANQATLTETNHLHFIVNGCYGATELAKDDVRFEMLRNLLNGRIEQEIALSEKLAIVAQRETGLPAYEYKSGNATRLGEFVWARNLLANRLYQSPVVFSELYVMNNRSVFERIQLGAYSGKRSIEGVERSSIYEEYAESLARGLKEYFCENRPLRE